MHREPLHLQIDDEGAKFENMVALELFRTVANWNDLGYGEFGLHYIRAKEGREVDFPMTEPTGGFERLENCGCPLVVAPAPWWLPNLP